MSNTAVVYWSGTGNTEAMANAVVKGVDAFDAIAVGCPSMGSEELEDSEFEPMFSNVKGRLAGRKIALFGSYGWGDGEWMRSWEEDCQSCGAVLAADSVICNDAPDEDAIAQCEALGAALV